MTLHVPNPIHLKQEESKTNQLHDQLRDHTRILQVFFKGMAYLNLQKRLESGDVLQNLDGTLVFPEPISEHERFYLDLFNPENKYHKGELDQ